MIKVSAHLYMAEQCDEQSAILWQPEIHAAVGGADIKSRVPRHLKRIQCTQQCLLCVHVCC